MTKHVKILGLLVILVLTSCESEKTEEKEKNVSPMVKEFAELDCKRIQVSTKVRQNPDDQGLVSEEERINKLYLERAKTLQEELGGDDFNQLMLDARDYNKTNCKY